MIAALVRKEIRELAPLLVLAVLKQSFLLASAVGSLPEPIDFFTTTNSIPFYNPLNDGGAIFWMILIGGAFAVLAGLWQTLSELMRGTFPFLLHRPLPRTRVFGIKLSVGVAACLLLTVVPIFGYALWVSSPGTLPSPFYWSMTGPAWLLCLGVVLLYLATFLSGLRSARWYVSRFLPVPLALVVGIIGYALPVGWFVVAAGLLLVIAIYIVAIMYVACSRDFS